MSTSTSTLNLSLSLDPYHQACEEDLVESKNNQGLSKRLTLFYYRFERYCDIATQLVKLFACALPLICIHYNYQGLQDRLSKHLGSEVKSLAIKVWLAFIPNITWHSFDSVVSILRHAPLPRNYPLEIFSHPFIKESDKNYALYIYQKLKTSKAPEKLDLLFLETLSRLPKTKALEKKLPSDIELRQQISQIFNDDFQERSYLDEAIGSCIFHDIKNPQLPSSPYLFHGPSGTGKTATANRIAQLMGRPIIYLPLAGVQSLKDLIGDETAPGLIIQKLCQSQVQNPIFLFDELDKVTDPQIHYFFIQFLDPLYRSQFEDRFLGSISYDLSQSSLFFSLNEKDKLPLSLIDRLESIPFYPLSINAKKLAIQKIWPKYQTLYLKKADEFPFSDELFEQLILGLEKDPGLRSLIMRTEAFFKKVSTFNL